MNPFRSLEQRTHFLCGFHFVEHFHDAKNSMLHFLTKSNASIIEL